ncbi:MAG: cytochrome oxidase small assembly protein [Sulfuricaulis sp.]|nr:cytochrome oxidase small assembly protein [Sulfuricaulis sp.]
MNRRGAGNKKTALILATVALGFFFAIMLKYWLAK